MTGTGADAGDPRIETGAAWDAFCRALEASKRIVLGEGVPDSPQLRAEGFRYLTRFLEAGIRTCVEYTDSDYPEFCRMIERGMTWGLDCPDCLYLYAPVRGDAEYRICGTRGSANHLDVQVNYGHFAFGDISQWGTISSLSGPDLELGPDGNFEIALAAEGRPGHWLRLAPNAEFVLVRQYFDDWENERPADLGIERLRGVGGVGGSASAAPPRTDQMAARLERLTQWLERGGALWESMSRGLITGSTNRLNVFKLPDEDARGGLAGQAYGMGGFRCEPGEALVVSFEPPDCRHWSISLASWYWETIDYATRQSCLNRSQARLDADGVFRGVIAHEDPGVPNWLDPGGHVQGTLAARFLQAETAPSVELETLALADLRSRLPVDTPHVTRDERSQQLARRHRAVLARYRR